MATITRDHIRNPAEWGVDQLGAANEAPRPGRATRCGSPPPPGGRR